jgi:hypothetical protein
MAYYAASLVATYCKIVCFRYTLQILLPREDVERGERNVSLANILKIGPYPVESTRPALKPR